MINTPKKAEPRQYSSLLEGFFFSHYFARGLIYGWICQNEQDQNQKKDKGRV